MSWAFREVLTRQPRQSYHSLLLNVRELLAGKYSQKPVLSSSHPIDTRLLFMFWVCRRTSIGWLMIRIDIYIIGVNRNFVLPVNLPNTFTILQYLENSQDPSTGLPYMVMFWFCRDRNCFLLLHRLCHSTRWVGPTRSCWTDSGDFNTKTSTSPKSQRSSTQPNRPKPFKGKCTTVIRSWMTKESPSTRWTPNYSKSFLKTRNVNSAQGPLRVKATFFFVLSILWALEWLRAWTGREWHWHRGQVTLIRHRRDTR